MERGRSEQGVFCQKTWNKWSDRFEVKQASRDTETTRFLKGGDGKSVKGGVWGSRGVWEDEI